jgi:hypothetical protein
VTVAVRRVSPDDLRAAVWTVRCLARYRLQERRRRVEDIAFPPAGRIGVSGSRAVARILGRRDQRCLSNALIAQAWRADHGDYVDVIIGVASPATGFSAHAWLADTGDAGAGGHAALSRIAPRQVRRRVPSA